MEPSLLLLVLVAIITIAIIRSWFWKQEVKEPKQPSQKSDSGTIDPSNSHSSVQKNDAFSNNGCGTESCACKQEKTSVSKMKILYGSQTGTAKKWAMKLSEEAKSKGFTPQVIDLAVYDPEEINEEATLIFIISTYTDGQPPETCAAFYRYLEDLSVDFRVPKTYLQNVRYAVFGIGSSVYDSKNFNKVGKEVHKMMRKLSAKPIVPMGVGDNGPSVEVEEGYEIWSKKLWGALQGCDSHPKSQKIRTSEEPDEDSADELENREGAEPLVDVEDMGKMMKKSKKIDEEEDDDDLEEARVKQGLAAPKEMLTDSLRQALTKQGYKLLGSHSGVKLCRWTKAMLRGRGGCYKHTFYGITSYQCMEMTPSLACANKCVFCWRHHKNPVGREWRWKVDAPEQLIEAAVKNHQSLIKQLKGVPGVDKERYEEAFTIRHCALSLVGEPIIYPHINEFIKLLHQRRISSFMVTNAQFPDKIESLDPVTQLYVSIDAATKDSLKQVDRPIFSDFWERFLGSIEALKAKGQRTVFRLTLIKDWNMEEIQNYAELVERGQPSFIEIKGVTYCGTSEASNLTMKNVPFHEEVRKFSETLCNASPLLRENYALACEHEHSCCILIANKKFNVNGTWNTWIDYDKFHELVKSGNTFTAYDYMQKTPSWAIIGSEERGFDPEEVRFKRNKTYQGQGC